MYGSSKRQRLNSGESKNIVKNEKLRRKPSKHTSGIANSGITGVPRNIQRAESPADLCHSILMNDKDLYTKDDVLKIIMILEKMNGGTNSSFSHEECSYIS